MNIDQPNEDLIMTPAIQNKLIALRQQISDKETEIVRLNSIIISNEYTVQQLSNSRAELEVLVPTLEKKKDEAKSILTATVEQIADAKNELLKIEREGAEIASLTAKRLEEVSKAEDEVVKARETLKIDQEALSASQNVLISERAVLDAKIAKLKEIIN